VSLFERYAKGGDDSDLKDWAGKTLPKLQHHRSSARRRAWASPVSRNDPIHGHVMPANLPASFFARRLFRVFLFFSNCSASTRHGSTSQAGAFYLDGAVLGHVRDPRTASHMSLVPASALSSSCGTFNTAFKDDRNGMRMADDFDSTHVNTP
jgi:hypothetical protein